MDTGVLLRHRILMILDERDAVRAALRGAPQWSPASLAKLAYRLRKAEVRLKSLANRRSKI